MSESRRPRLDMPREARRSLVRRPTYDSDAFGSFAEQFARFMGTAKFLIYMTLFVIVWMLWNTLAPQAWRFDEFPFIFLTLMLSLQASYAAPLILLAQNRQTDRDRVVGEQDRARDERGLADTEYLTREVASLRIAMREVATRDFVRSELRALLEDLDERAAAHGEDAADAPARNALIRQHLGIYAYTPTALRAWVELPVHPLERIERLEQLRPLAAGVAIGVAAATPVALGGIDTEADLVRANAHWDFVYAVRSPA